MLNLFCLRTRKWNDVSLSRPHKWSIYIIGLLETFVFTGCIFGWAQLVYVLKNEQIFLNLCQSENETVWLSQNQTNEEVSLEDIKLHGCPKQDQAFGLIFTVGCIFYSATAILSGSIIHYYGLVVARTFATLSLSGGFLALGHLTKENTFWLWVSVILLTYGGNQLRLSGFQFCNLFPENKSTALTIISGSYAASAGLFLIFQVGRNHDFSLWFMSLCLALLALLSTLASVIMPWHHIPYENSIESCDIKIPFRQSFFSLSTFTYNFWFLTLVIGVRFFNLSFNPWISRISNTNEEAGIYSSLYSFSYIFSVVITPLPGMLNDYFTRKAKSAAGSNKEKFLQKELLSPVVTLTATLILTMILTCCLLFDSSVAIYTSLAMLIIIGPCMISVGAAFVRIRYPPEHFDRINGICGTLVSIFTFLQYPFFLWVQTNPTQAILCFALIILIAFSHPFHLLSKTYRKKVAKERFQNFAKQELLNPVNMVKS